MPVDVHADRGRWPAWLLWAAPAAAAAAAIMIWIAVPDSPPTQIAQIAQPTTDIPLEAPARVESFERAGSAPSAPQASKPGAPAPLAATPPVAAPAAAARANAVPSAAADEATAAPEDEAPEGQRASESPTITGEARLARKAEAHPPIEITSTDSSIRWRVSGLGTVAYTGDGGSTWEERAVGGASRVAAGASPSPSVCWLVGSQGTVLLTTDGVSWRLLPPPTALDLTAVQADDARTATVVAADSRRFRTIDAGQSWQEGPLQGF
jgi:hypothetical protein